jgi:hypothetical protein
MLREPRRDSFFELRLDDAIQMTGVLDLNHRSVLSRLLERCDVEPLRRIAIADDYFNRNSDRSQLRLGQSQLAETACASRRSAAALSLGHSLPEVLQRAAFVKPSHAADNPAEHSILMLSHELHRDHASHRIADDVGPLDVEVIQKPDNVFDQLGSVCRSACRLVRLSVPGQVQSDDLIILREHADDAGHLPVHPYARVESVNEHDGLAFAFDDVMESDSVGVERLR